MKPINNRIPSIKLERILWAQFFAILTFGGLSLRLWFLQTKQGHIYQKISENNLIRKIDIPAARGIFDQWKNYFR